MYIKSFSSRRSSLPKQALRVRTQSRLEISHFFTGEVRQTSKRWKIVEAAVQALVSGYKKPEYAPPRVAEPMQLETPALARLFPKHRFYLVGWDMVAANTLEGRTAPVVRGLYFTLNIPPKGEPIKLHGFGNFEEFGSLMNKNGVKIESADDAKLIWTAFNDAHQKTWFERQSHRQVSPSEWALGEYEYESGNRKKWYRITLDEKQTVTSGKLTSEEVKNVEPQKGEKPKPLATTLYPSGKTMRQLTLWIQDICPPDSRVLEAFQADDRMRIVPTVAYMLTDAPLDEPTNRKLVWLTHVRVSSFAPHQPQRWSAALAWHEASGKATIAIFKTVGRAATVQLHQVRPCEEIGTFPLELDLKNYEAWPRAGPPLARLERLLRGEDGSDILRISVVPQKEHVLIYGERESAEDPPVFLRLNLETLDWSQLNLVATDASRNSTNK